MFSPTLGQIARNVQLVPMFPLIKLPESKNKIANLAQKVKGLRPCNTKILFSFISFRPQSDQLNKYLQQVVTYLVSCAGQMYVLQTADNVLVNKACSCQ